jgi:hypothetical protein
MSVSSRPLLRGLALSLVAAVGLSACGGDGGAAGNPGPSPNPGTPPVSVFDLANRCFVLRSGAVYVVQDGNGFVARATAAADGARLYMKPTALGRYLFHTADGRVLTANGAAVTAAADPVDGSDWSFQADNGRYTASTQDLALGVDGDGRLVAGDTPATLTFEPASDCTPYPEMPTGIAGKTYTGPPAGQPVIGFAEVHAHMAMGGDMSDGTGDRGPSAGGVMYGQAVHRFGIPHAMRDCAEMHGPNGSLSPENIILDNDPTQTHDTQGWPSFVDWPARDSQLHAQMYYRWVERAWKAGMRVIVSLGTNIEALCDIAKMTVGDASADCTDMGVGLKQVAYLSDIQNYVDAQEGGPGRGWFRIVKNPAEARAVIAEGKLAVVPGLEFSNLFRCNVRYLPDGSEIHGCTREDIDRQIDEIWELGIRAVFPYHDVDSALGGAGIFSSVLNLVNFYGTGGFWRTYPCDDGGEGPGFFYTAGAVMESAPLTQFNDPISQALIGNAQGLLPVYGPGRQCNARTVTDLGRYAINKIMKKGFTIDIDHAEIRSKQILLDEGARTNPAYPMISGHGGHGGISNAQAQQILRQGGIIYPSVQNGVGYQAFLEKLKPIWASSGTAREIAIGYGADATGLANLAPPRGAGSEGIRYPFTLFQGAGWGPQFAAAGIEPLTVEMLSIPGGQSWNMDEVGMAHYGLVADIVEEIRIEGGEEAISTLYRSAETYLQLWEQTLAAAADAQALPTP